MVKDHVREEPSEVAPVLLQSAWERKGWLKAALMVAWLAGYVLALTWFGFIIATIPAFFLLILLFTWKEKKNYVAAAVYAVVYAVGAYFLFTRVLNVILPTGKLF